MWGGTSVLHGFAVLQMKPFDDYYKGPSLEDTRMLAQMGGLESQPLDWFSNPTVWELFRDWGYRLRENMVTSS
jgi:hypothetical protein